MMVKRGTRVILYSICALLLLSGAVYGAAWDYVEFKGNSFGEVYILDQNHIVGGTSGSGGMNGGKLYYSGDGGNTWKNTTDYVANIGGIKFADSRNGYAVGGFIGFGVDMYIGKTSDGGLTWTNLNDNFMKSLNYQLYVPLFGLSVIDANKIYASSQTYVFTTSDGGVTWSPSEVKLDGTYEQYLNGKTLQFVDASNGFVATNKRLFRTTDGSMSWSPNPEFPWVTEDNGAETPSIFMLNANDGWASAYLNNNKTEGKYRIYRTSNGGATWNLIYISPDWIGSVYFRNSYEGYAGGADAIWHTTNGGMSWTQEHKGSSYQSMYFLPSGISPRPAVVSSGGYYSGYMIPGTGTPTVTPTVTITPTVTATPTKPSGGEMVTNGDFSSGLGGWTIMEWFKASDGKGEVTAESDGIRFLSKSGNNNIGIMQTLNADVSGCLALNLRATIKADEQALSGTGFNGREAPIAVFARYTDINGVLHGNLGEDPKDPNRMFWTGLYFMDPTGSSITDFGIKTQKGEWYNYEFDLMKLSPKPKTIDIVGAEGAGWPPRDGKVKSISLTCTAAGETPRIYISPTYTPAISATGPEVTTSGGTKDFAVGISPTSLTVNPGDTLRLTLTVMPSGGFNEPVDIYVKIKVLGQERDLGKVTTVYPPYQPFVFENPVPSEIPKGTTIYGYVTAKGGGLERNADTVTVKVPGFEILPVIAAIAIAMFLVRRKK
ncbi:MAG: hypothetical protein O8C64_08430 [Candidatus Methanoperedens sp.]|nr:hypothetical protein [Candidatus Methanoperedens sp.]